MPACPHNMVTDFPKSRRCKGGPAELSSLRNDMPPFLLHSIDQTNSHTMLEGTMQGHEQQKVGDPWGSSQSLATTDEQREGEVTG